MKEISKLLKLFVVVLTGVSLSVSAFSGIVLCSGEDGRFNFELAAHDCCGDVAASDNHSHTSAGDMNVDGFDTCTVCVDVLLSIGSVLHSFSTEKFQCRLSAAGCLPYIFAVINRCVDVETSPSMQSYLSASLLKNRSSLTALRSTVLRV
jgi:hypothetical protein